MLQTELPPSINTVDAIALVDDTWDVTRNQLIYSCNKTGVVGKYYDHMGYGFIKQDDGEKDIFFHHYEMYGDDPSSGEVAHSSSYW